MRLLGWSFSHFCIKAVLREDFDNRFDKSNSLKIILLQKKILYGFLFMAALIRMYDFSE